LAQVAGLLSNLPAYRVGVSPVLRGVEVGLAHGFLLVGPFIKVHRPAVLLLSTRRCVFGLHFFLTHVSLLHFSLH
jgi:hypothetical protein